MTEASPIKIAIVGCGAVVRVIHMPALLRHPGVEIAALVDVNESNARLLAKEFGISPTITRSVRDVKEPLDAALLAVPPGLHAPIAIELLELGLDVLCEKPLAMTGQECREMVEAAERTDRHLAVGVLSRFHENNVILQRLLERKALGTVVGVHAEMGAKLHWGMTSNVYFDRSKSAGGTFFDSGVHVLDRIVWLFGSVKDVAFEDDSYGGVEANAQLTGTLTVDGNDVPLTVRTSWTHGLRNRIRVEGSQASVVLPLNNDREAILDLGPAYDGVSVRMTLDDPPPVRSVTVRQLDDFVESVRTRRAPFACASNAVHAIETIEKAYAVRSRMPQPWVEA